MDVCDVESCDYVEPVQREARKKHTRVLSTLTSRRLSVSDLAMTGTTLTRSCNDFINSTSTWRSLYSTDTTNATQQTLYSNELIHGFTKNGRGTCYSAAYTSQTRVQKRFTISEVAAD